ncbi:hypothetical protein LCGC14_0534070 [marine sediment metagenome]|uniref:Uncharacterized protein n=1 Tax=marine sediment metagenome TaxID=412755 RepID=A0A0F9V2T2_9ZZZZ
MQTFIEYLLETYTLIEAVVYGYWILPDNRLAKVDDFDHVEWYIRNVAKHARRLQREHGSEAVYEHAYKKGFIRVGFSDTWHTVSGKHDRMQEALPVIMNLLRRRPTRSVGVSLVNARGVPVDSGDFEWPAERGEMIRFVKGDR